MSAIYEESDGTTEPVKVLITLHDGMDTMDAVGTTGGFQLGIAR